MMNLQRIKNTLALLAAALMTVALPAWTVASPTYGTNDDLLPGGEIYIPFQQSYSGTLGDSLGGGKYVGRQSDSVSLSIFNSASSGSVTFELAFDLSAELGSGDTVDPSTAVLLLNFHDFDFKPSVSSTHSLQETLTMNFRADAGGATSGTTLTIDDTNYGLYSGGIFGETNNQTITYEISLAGDLGATPADFADINNDKEFALLVTLGAELNHRGLWSVQISNTPESIGNSFQFAAVPEPATLAMLAAGGGLIAARRRRRS